MATFKAEVLAHHLKEDGTYNVKIRVTHNRKKSYIPTPHHVVKKQLTKKLVIKDEFLIDELNRTIAHYRSMIVRLGVDLERYSAKDLSNYLLKRSGRSSENKINFIEFSKTHSEKIRKNGRARYAEKFDTVINSLIDFFGKDEITIDEINAKNLQKYQRYLQTERKMTRKGKLGTEVNFLKKPVSTSGIETYMISIRTLFNAARSEFNDEDLNDIRITHYPFQKFKIETSGKTKNKSLKIDEILKIREFPDHINHMSGLKHGINRVNFGRDIFMLTFYLAGINTVDLFTAAPIVNGRLTYNRTKTSGRRSDQANISIKVPEEAELIIERYKDTKGKRAFDFYNLYSTEKQFNRSANIGLKTVAKKLSLPDDLTTYYARHSFATIARNDCRCSKDDIALAMNHSDPTHRVTDIYLAKSWDIVDEVQGKVMSLMMKNNKSVL